MDDLEILRKIGQCEDKEQMVRVIQEYNESQKVKTNADRIRAMTDEELAEFLERTQSNMAIRLGGEFIVRNAEYIKIWLKQPAEV